MIVEPWHALEPARVTGVLGQSWVLQGFKKLAHSGHLAVELEDTQVGEHLALLGVVQFGATDCGGVIVVVEGV